MRSRRPILLLEDDDIDVMTVRRALRDIKVTNELVIAEDGEKGLDYLRDPDAEKPCIILLDLNMPRMNGLEFLHAVKQKPVLRRIPVVVLTSSQQEQDRVKSFDLGIAGYMLKPVNYQQFVEIVRTIDLYWTLSELPPPGGVT